MFIFVSTGISAQSIATSVPQQACTIEINTTGATRLLQPGACAGFDVNFAKSVSNSTIECSGAAVSRVLFDNGTYNNTLSNCTFSDNTILESMHSAHNNIIGSTGNYTPEFSDNSSDLAVGYYFTFISHSATGALYPQLYASVMPNYFANLSPTVFNSQQLVLSNFTGVASNYNYTLPRFGYYAPVNGSGSITFALEEFSLSKNSTHSFNPYWLICPAWGHDILSYYRFNITKNTIYAPSFIAPTTFENFQFPSNKPIYWNFTILNYSGANEFTLYLFNGPQWGFVRPFRIFNAVKAGNFSFKEGLQNPGIYQYVAEIYNNSNGKYEQDNSTTTNYGVGAAFCTAGIPLVLPGYYPMVYKNLTELHTYNTAGMCNIGLIIQSGNVTLNCRGGTINSKTSSIVVVNSDNVSIENCVLRGNALNISDSKVEIHNTSIIANNPNDTAITSEGSNVTLFNVSISNYSTYDAPVGVVMRSVKIITPMTSQFRQLQWPRITLSIALLALFGITCIMCFLIYYCIKP